MKRLDLIFSERELDAIIKTLEKANVPGYTVMKHFFLSFGVSIKTNYKN